MKILYVIKDLDIGGAQRLVSELLPFIKQEHEVDLLLFQEEINLFSKKVHDAGIRVICQKASLKNPISIWKLRKVIRQYDLVHVHLFPELYLSALAAWGTKVPLVFTEHSTSNRRRGKAYLRPLEKWMYHRYKRIITISQQTQDALMQWVQARLTDKRFVVIENGINTEAFRRVQKSVDSQDNDNIGQEAKSVCQIIMVSRFVEAKDQETVIRAMKHLDDTFHLSFVGDGERMPVCQQLVKDMGMEERVSFLGRSADIPSLVCKADIGVQSSHWEGFGLTAVELMAAGLPVVATDVPGLKQVVENAGLLFDAGDDKQLAQHIKELATNKALYQDVSKRCLQRSAQYDISVTAHRYSQLYHEVKGNH